MDENTILFSQGSLTAVREQLLWRMKQIATRCSHPPPPPASNSKLPMPRGGRERRRKSYCLQSHTPDHWMFCMSSHNPISGRKAGLTVFSWDASLTSRHIILGFGFNPPFFFKPCFLLPPLAFCPSQNLRHWGGCLELHRTESWVLVSAWWLQLRIRCTFLS